MLNARSEPYQAKYPDGSAVVILGEGDLREFQRTWKYHHKLDEQQIGFAGEHTVVESVGYYHGGDPPYELKGIPGYWHEQCLGPC